MIRIGFTKIGGEGWWGGHNYLVNLLGSLVEGQSSVLTPVLFVDPDVERDDLDDYYAIPGLEIVRSNSFSLKRKNLALLNAILFGRDRKIGDSLREKKIDVVFEVARFFGWRESVPAIAWIPDLQHRDLAEFFGIFAWWKRELGFRVQISSGRKVMVSSEDAKLSCEQFYLTKAGQVKTVSFAVPFPDLSVCKSADEITKKYELPTSFFYMPNHFWKHKNHQLVVEALALLKDDDANDIVVVASGNTVDPRNPRYFVELERNISTRGLEKQFRILGLIPYCDVLALLRASKGLLNPSLYEGWSTTVEEARSLGVPMVLSDLPVHKEQATNLASFFERNSAPSLAYALASFVGRQLESDEALRAGAHKRRIEFGNSFAELAKTVVGH